MDLMLNSQVMTFLLSDHPIAVLAQTGARTGAKAVAKAPVKSPNWILTALITLVVTAIAFYLLSLVFPFIEIDTPVTALVCALVFGALNIISQPIENLLNITWILAPIALLINMATFWITDLVISGFRITNGIIGILVGSVALTIIQIVLKFAINAIF
jgi:putative membrane protein